MSWAAGRHTRRPEDQSYCLLGLFDVNIPLPYDEGEKAFVRLQERIVQTTTDQSILLGHKAAPDSVWSLNPDAFRNLSRVVAVPSSHLRSHQSQKTGILIRLPINDTDPRRTYAVLNCRYEDDFTGKLGIDVRIGPEMKRQCWRRPRQCHDGVARKIRPSSDVL